MNKKHVVIALLVGVIVGTAYGARIPVLGMIAKKLPNAAV